MLPSNSSGAAHSTEESAPRPAQIGVLLGPGFCGAALSTECSGPKKARSGRFSGTSSWYFASCAPLPAQAFGNQRTVFSTGMLMVFMVKLRVSACQMGMGASTCCPVTTHSVSRSGPAHAAWGANTRESARAPAEISLFVLIMRIIITLEMGLRQFRDEAAPPSQSLTPQSAMLHICGMLRITLRVSQRGETRMAPIASL